MLHHWHGTREVLAVAWLAGVLLACSAPSEKPATFTQITVFPSIDSIKEKIDVVGWYDEPDNMGSFFHIVDYQGITVVVRNDRDMITVGSHEESLYEQIRLLFDLSGHSEEEIGYWAARFTNDASLDAKECLLPSSVLFKSTVLPSGTSVKLVESDSYLSSLFTLATPRFVNYDQKADAPPCDA